MPLSIVPTHDAGGVFGPVTERPGIAGTAYDTAWLASVPARGNRRRSTFPTALQWLVDHQHPDGSWGGALRYEHDRILSTLAALVPLATFGRRAADRACVAAGTRYLWQHAHLMTTEPMELVGFELLLPTLVQRARQAGIAVPVHLDVYGRERRDKLRLIPPEVLYSPRITVVHSLEFLGDDVDADGLRAAQGANGAIGNSPAATAFYLSLSDDARALTYLQGCQARSGGAMAPVLHPCETFELLWAAYHLFLASVPAARLLSPHDRRLLREALDGGGVSLSPTFPIPDADDTAVALLMLHNAGEPVDCNVLRAFQLAGTHTFASFPHERHPSVGVNVHVLHALLRVPGYVECDRAVDAVVESLASQQVDGLYWLDKWHISPYYATAHVLRVLRELPAASAGRSRRAVERAYEWLRRTQNEDGSWGFYGRPTAEETAYGLLALAGLPEPDRHDRARCGAAARFLKSIMAWSAWDDAQAFPPLWIDKCLYTPPLVVAAVIESALLAHAHAHAGPHARAAAPGRRVAPRLLLAAGT